MSNQSGTQTQRRHNNRLDTLTTPLGEVCLILKDLNLTKAYIRGMVEDYKTELITPNTYDISLLKIRIAQQALKGVAVQLYT